MSSVAKPRGEATPPAASSSRCAGQTVAGERCKNKTFDGQTFCFRHNPNNKSLSVDYPCDEGVNPYYDITDAAAEAAGEKLPQKARDLLTELKLLIRKKREVFDEEHISVLNSIRRELRQALDRGANEGVVLLVLHQLRACACNKKALQKFIEHES